MKFTVNYEITPCTAIHPITGIRTPAFLVSRECNYKDTINSDSDEISWLFWKNSILGCIEDPGDNREAAEIAIDFFLDWLDNEKLQAAPALTHADHFDKYGIEFTEEA